MFFGNKPKLKVFLKFFFGQLSFFEKKNGLLFFLIKLSNNYARDTSLSRHIGNGFDVRETLWSVPFHWHYHVSLPWNMVICYVSSVVMWPLRLDGGLVRLPVHFISNVFMTYKYWLLWYWGPFSGCFCCERVMLSLSHYYCLLLWLVYKTCLLQRCRLQQQNCSRLAYFQT